MTQGSEVVTAFSEALKPFLASVIELETSEHLKIKSWVTGNKIKVKYLHFFNALVVLLNNLKQKNKINSASTNIHGRGKSRRVVSTCLRGHGQCVFESAACRRQGTDKDADQSLASPTWLVSMNFKRDDGSRRLMCSQGTVFER